MASAKITMTHVLDRAEIADSADRHRRFGLNCDWVNTHARDVYQHRGKFVCVAGQELFVGATMPEVLEKAQKAHPADDAPFVKFVPIKKLEAIYAPGREMAHL